MAEIVLNINTNNIEKISRAIKAFRKELDECGELVKGTSVQFEPDKIKAFLRIETAKNDVSMHIETR